MSLVEARREACDTFTASDGCLMNDVYEWVDVLVDGVRVGDVIRGYESGHHPLVVIHVSTKTRCCAGSRECGLVVLTDRGVGALYAFDRTEAVERRQKISNAEVS